MNHYKNAQYTEHNEYGKNLSDEFHLEGMTFSNYLSGRTLLSIVKPNDISLFKEQALQKFDQRLRPYSSTLISVLHYIHVKLVISPPTDSYRVHGQTPDR